MKEIMDCDLIGSGNIATRASSDAIRNLKSILYKLDYMNLIFFDSEEANFLETLVYESH